MDPQHTQIAHVRILQSSWNVFSTRVLRRSTIGLFLLLLLTGCRSTQDTYLAQAIDHATTGELEQVLGPPTHEQILATGRRFWLYRREASETGGRNFMPYCQDLWLTFDQEGILRAWQQQRC